MKSLKEQAEYYRLCLVLSFVTVAEVVAWADTMILNSVDLSPQIIDLALAGNRYKDEVMDCLLAIPGHCDYESIAITVFQEIQERHRDTENQEGQIKLIRLFFETVKLPDNNRELSCLFETDLWCLEDGYGSLDEIMEEIIDYLFQWREKKRSATSSPTPPSSSPPGRAC